MEIKQYQAAIEAILFASGEPVELERLAEAIEMEKNITEAVADELMEEYIVAFGSARNAMFRLKENWGFLHLRFDNTDKYKIYRRKRK